VDIICATERGVCIKDSKCASYLIDPPLDVLHPTTEVEAIAGGGAVAGDWFICAAKNCIDAPASSVKKSNGGVPTAVVVLLVLGLVAGGVVYKLRWDRTKDRAAWANGSTRNVTTGNLIRNGDGTSFDNPAFDNPPETRFEDEDGSGGGNVRSSYAPPQASPGSPPRPSINVTHTGYAGYGEDAADRTV
jgi:hypothetical protein